MVWIHPRDKKPAKKELPPIFNNEKWRACYTDWINSLTPGTAELYGGLTRRFFVDPKKTPDRYTQQEARAFINAVLEKGVHKGELPCPNTRNTKLTALNAFYSFATGYDVRYRKTVRPLLSGRAPTHNIKIIEAPEIDRAMSDEEITRFFAAIDRGTITGLRDRALFLTYFWTGRRLREICRMTFADIEQGVSFENGRVGIRYAWIGKGRVNKSYAEMPPDAWEAIHDYLVTSGRWETMTPASPVFTAHDTVAALRGERFLTKESINKIHRKYVKKAGLVDMHGVHDFRHTCAVISYIASDYNILEVKTKLDHTNIGSTMRYVRNAVSKGDATALKLRSKYGGL